MIESVEPFRLGLTPDFLDSQGRVGWGDIGLDTIEGAPSLEWSFLSADNAQEVGGDAAANFESLLVLGSRITRQTVKDAERLVHVARFGVGYDTVDVAACSEAGVLVTITPDAVRRPVAVAALTLILAVTHQLLPKDRITRTGHWNDRMTHMGSGLTGKRLGLVGFGNIGRELVRITRPLDFSYLACDPYADAAVADQEGVRLTGLDDLLETSDIVCVLCSLTPETYHLLGRTELAKLRPTAFLINVARGPIIDQAALTALLREGRIRGAGLDVFEQEPLDAGDEILGLPNVVLTPHALCWTDELALLNGSSALGAVLDVYQGRTPRFIVNPDALQHPRIVRRLRDVAKEE